MISVLSDLMEVFSIEVTYYDAELYVDCFSDIYLGLQVIVNLYLMKMES